MKSILILAAILAIIPITNAKADNGLAGVVKICVTDVNTKSMLGFDAYVEPVTAVIKSFGTPQDRFTFYKCMASYGFSIN